MVPEFSDLLLPLSIDDTTTFGQCQAGDNLLVAQFWGSGGRGGKARGVMDGKCLNSDAGIVEYR